MLTSMAWMVAGVGVAASAMPGSMSAGRVEAAVSSLEAACAVVGSCYGGVEQWRALPDGDSSGQ